MKVARYIFCCYMFCCYSLCAALLVGGCSRGPQAVVIQEEFDQIQTGMSHQRVDEIIGERGTPIGGGSMFQDGTFTHEYKWTNPDGSYAIVFFRLGLAQVDKSTAHNLP